MRKIIWGITALLVAFTIGFAWKPKIEIHEIEKPLIIIKSWHAKNEQAKKLAYLIFKDDPRMLRILHCESEMRQYNKHNEALISHTNDIGIGQINIPTWGKVAKRKGLDLTNAVDNLAMVQYIRDTEGYSQWVCDSKV